jgi:hypothetical protein
LVEEHTARLLDLPLPLVEGERERGHFLLEHDGKAAEEGAVGLRSLSFIQRTQDALLLGAKELQASCRDIRAHI